MRTLSPHSLISPKDAKRTKKEEVRSLQQQEQIELEERERTGAKRVTRGDKKLAGIVRFWLLLLPSIERAREREPRTDRKT